MSTPIHYLHQYQRDAIVNIVHSVIRESAEPLGRKEIAKRTDVPLEFLSPVLATMVIKGQLRAEVREEGVRYCLREGQAKK